MTFVRALQGLIAACEAVYCDDQCGLGSDATNPDAHQDTCNRGRMLRALAALRSSSPLAEDGELALDVEAWIFDNRHFAVTPQRIRAVLAALEARLRPKEG